MYDKFIRLVKLVKLKSFFGLRRKRNNKKKFNGIIEHITPSFISGWVFHQEYALEEVIFFYGENRISKSKILTYRNDVNQSFNVEGNVGFCIFLPEEVPIFDNNNEPKVVVFSKDKGFSSELFSMEGKDKTKLKLKKLINSEVIGIQGHIDGILHDDFIHGWVLKNNQIQPSEAWMQ